MAALLLLLLLIAAKEAASMTEPMAPPTVSTVASKADWKCSAMRDSHATGEVGNSGAYG